MCEVFFERRERILESFAFCGRATLAVQFKKREEGRKERGWLKGKGGWRIFGTAHPNRSSPTIANLNPFPQNLALDFR